MEAAQYCAAHVLEDHRKVERIGAHAPGQGVNHLTETAA
jgi:hypothetical protein